MADFQQKPNSGVLFKNYRKDKQTSPDMAGTFNINGQEYFINGWQKSDKNGNMFLTFMVNPKTAQTPPQYQPTPAQAPPTPPIFTQYKKPAGEPLPKDLPEHHVTKETFRSDTQEPRKDDQFDPDDIPF